MSEHAEMLESLGALVRWVVLVNAGLDALISASGEPSTLTFDHFGDREAAD